ncbi:MAG: type IA DNA topoisomerase [Oscillospiraceae bacterium]|nr:type IA DNA topoisomerase [Oscillospiraceae bacterium]
MAQTLGAHKKVYGRDGKNYCYCNDDYYVINAVGHLYDIGTPNDYGYTDWTLESLPILPDFRIMPTKDSSKDGLRQFISELMGRNDVDEIICATDAAREGELIFRHIYDANGCTKPCKRAWFSSMTEEAIKTAFSNLKPISDYDNLYKAAYTREQLDWIFGMNGSRLYCVLDKTRHMVGRVKTPLLRIIVDRDNEIDNFQSNTAYKLTLANGAISTAEYEDKSLAEDEASKANGKTVTVSKAERKNMSENRPLLHSLSTLQMEANDRLGFSAQKTLDIAQSLYEKRLITYPRTDSNYLTDDMRIPIHNLAEILANYTEYKERIDKLLENGLNIDERIIDEAKVSDHHAIIPTNSIRFTGMTEDELAVYRIIINRLLCALDSKYEYIQITYEFICNDITYRLKTKETIQLGFKAYTDKSDLDCDDEIAVKYAEGDTFSADGISVKECVTKPKKHFTDKTLLSVMDNIDNRISDGELKAAVSGKGIGTPATRAGIIEELIGNHYIDRNNKEIISTQFGRDFIASIPNTLKAVERTAEWEQFFDIIQKTGADSKPLFDNVISVINDTIEYEKNHTRDIVKNPYAPKKTYVVVGKCPRCGGEIVDKGKFYGCTSYESKENCGCGFTLNKSHPFISGEIKPEQITLLLDGKSVSLRSINRENEQYTVEYILQDADPFPKLIRQQAEKVSLGKCPWCGKNVYEGKNNFYCESGRDCGFSIWKEDRYNSLNITAQNVKELLNKGKSKFSKKALDGTIAEVYSLSYREKDDKKYVNLTKEK